MLSRAGIVARRQSVFATFVLLALVSIQSYWLIGNSLIQATPARTPEDSETVRRALGDIEADRDLREQLTPVQNKGQTAGAAPSPTPITEEELKASADKASAARKVLDAFEMQDTHRELITQMLACWAWYFPTALPSSTLPSARSLEQTKRTLEWYAAVDRVFIISGRILDILQQYVLPLLYGLLGATAFVIRTISQQARDRLYRAENEAGYYLRMWLGVLGGLAIGWFIKPTGGGIGSLSPLALAFVAGYSVDLLFTAMDRIVGAFSGPEKPPETKEQPVVPAVPK